MKISLMIGIGASLLLFSGCEQMAESLGPACKVVSQESSESLVNASNDFDYGIKLDYVLYNTGASGDVLLTSTLRTSEGDFTRQMTVRLNSEESRTLSFLYSEPSIRALCV